MPLSVVRRIMDLPPEVDPMIKQLSAGIAALENNPAPAEDQIERFDASVQELLGFNVEVLRDRCERPRGDYISDVVQMQVDRDGELDVNALARHLAMTIFGADHAMGGHLADLAARLGRDRGLQERLRADRSLVRGFVLETLRQVTPVPWVFRHCVADATIGEVDVPAGSLVLVASVAGNHDPEEFPDPERFDIERRNLERNQLSLGRGSHRCAGAPIARLLAEVTVNRLLDRLVDIRLDESRSDLTPPPSYVFRIAKSVHLTFDRRNG
jgi:cytochrome P450